MYPRDAYPGAGAGIRDPSENSGLTLDSTVRTWTLKRAVHVLHSGGILAYPTEAVYGLGCDPFNLRAVLPLLRLKRRPVETGLILVAAEFSQLEPLLAELPAQVTAKVLSTWPGPVTWLWPASQLVPVWIRGRHGTVAVRVSAHPMVRALCTAWGGPLISTSANPHGRRPARRPLDVQRYFGAGVDLILHGVLGNAARPTEIRDARNNTVVRQA